MKVFTITFLAIIAVCYCHAQGNPPCFNTPFFATGGNWFIPMTSVNQEHCFLDQCNPIVAVNAIDMDFIGYKRARVVAPNSHVSAVFTTYDCDSVLSVQCDGVVGDTASFDLDYQQPCLLFFLSDVADTIFVLPGPDSTQRQPQPYVCFTTSVQDAKPGREIYKSPSTGEYRDLPLPPGLWIKSCPEDPYRKPEKIIVLF